MLITLGLIRESCCLTVFPMSFFHDGPISTENEPTYCTCSVCVCVCVCVCVRVRSYMHMCVCNINISMMHAYRTFLRNLHTLHYSYIVVCSHTDGKDKIRNILLTGTSTCIHTMYIQNQ